MTYTKVNLEVNCYHDSACLSLSVPQQWNNYRDIDETDTIHPKIKAAPLCKTYRATLDFLKKIRADQEVLNLIQFKPIGRPEPEYQDLTGIIKWIHRSIQFSEMQNIVEISEFLEDNVPQFDVTFWGVRLIRLGNSILSLGDLIERITKVADNTRYNPQVNASGLKIISMIDEFCKQSDEKLKEKFFITKIAEWIRNRFQWIINGQQPLQKIYAIMKDKLS